MDVRGYIPTPSSLLMNKCNKPFIICELFGILGFLRIHFIIQRYYKHIIPKAAQAAKVQITKILKWDTVISIVIIISHLIFLFISPNSHPFIHFSSLYIFFIFNNIFNYEIVRLNRIKIGEMYPPGFILDIIVFFLNLIGMPLYLWQVSKGDMYSQFYTFTTLVPDSLFIITPMKFVFLGMLLFGDKFFEYPESWYQ